MKRDLTQLSNRNYDLCIIGGGIYGACVAWDATLKGLSVALVDKSDFGSATSANSMKMIHGGLRYLQHGDLKRMRESICERRTLMRIAPHLVHPLPILIPAYGHGRQGKEVLSLALMINDLVSFDRNRLKDPEKYIPRGRVISRKDLMQLFPGINSDGLTGGVLFYDAQVYNSERLILSFLRSAKQGGADLANYVSVTGFLQNKDHVVGVQVRDELMGDKFDIRARIVVNTSGPWVYQILDYLNGNVSRPQVQFVKAFNLVTRPLFKNYAVGISGEKGYHDTDSLMNRGSRFFFITPWRDHSIIGTAYARYDGGPEQLSITRNEIQIFLDEINQAHPAADLTLKDVAFVHAGLVPSSSRSSNTGNIQLAKRHQIEDHREAGVKGLISVIGVKYTTARLVAEKVVDRVFRMLGTSPSRARSESVPVYGGQIEQFEAFLKNEIRKRPSGLDEKQIRHLVYNYGAAYTEVLHYFESQSDGGTDSNHTHALLKASVLHAVHEEMAQKLSDVVFRRTDLGTAGDPGESLLNLCANVISEEMGWDKARIARELEEVRAVFPSMGRAPVCADSFNS